LSYGLPNTPLALAVNVGTNLAEFLVIIGI
jgi:hypothetical protein